jgi:hypothetical protein
MLRGGEADVRADFVISGSPGVESEDMPVARWPFP